VRDILRLPYAYRALRAMPQSGVLTLLIPEFSAIDCLVIRDFYHRYTVDEHTFVTIRNLHRLKAGEERMSTRLAEIRAEFDRPERIYLALLLHDLGKGYPGGNPEKRSAELAEVIMERLQVDAPDRDLVRFLIAEHLKMSTTMTGRDITEPDTVERFAELVGTRERLKALTLLTYADTSAVNPGAMTPWRERLRWQR
jgi:[protein-PII] uridylyltransferase